MTNQETTALGDRISAALQGVAVIAILAAHVPLLVLHFARLWQGDQYRYFPFVLVAFALLVWARFREPLPDDARSAWRGWVMMTLGLLWLAASVLLWSPVLAVVAAIFSTGGVLRHLAGRRRWKLLVPVWLLLWLCVPLPFRWDSRLVFWLQGITSKAGSFVLDFLGYTHVLAGHVIEVPSQQFLVEEACSGVRSLFSLVATAAIFAVILRRPLVHLLLMVAGAVFWAVVVNIARVAAVVIFQVDHGINITSGWQHEVFGIVLFVAAMLLLLSTDRLLVFLLEPGEPPIDEIAPHAELDRPPNTRRSSRMALIPLGTTAVLFLLVGAAQLVPMAKDDATFTALGSSEELQAAFDEDTLPKQLGGWSQQDFQRTERDLVSNLGRHSAEWVYQPASGRAVVSFDYPFIGWHHLTDCYRAQGWEITSRSTEPSLSGGEPGLSIVAVEMRRPSGENGYLLFAQFDAEGNSIRAPDKKAWTVQSLVTATRDRVSKRLAQFGVDLSTYQLQVFVSGDEPIDESQRQQAAAALLTSRDRILAQFSRKESARASLVP